MSDYIETGAEGNALSLMDVIREEDDLLEQVDARENARRLYQAVSSCLTEQEQQVVIRRYGLYGRPAQRQREVAAELEKLRAVLE